MNSYISTLHKGVCTISHYSNKILRFLANRVPENIHKKTFSLLGGPQGGQRSVLGGTGPPWPPSRTAPAA